MFRIALIHEGEGRLAEARAAYREVLARFATQSIELDGRIETAGALARRKLNAAELRGAGTEEAAPLSTGVLGRLAERAWATASRPFVLDDGAEPALLLLGNQSAVTLVNMGQAAPVWSVEIGAEAEWAADHGDTILVGSAGQVTALARAGGGVLWRFKPGNGPTADPAPSPFTRIDPVPVGLAAKEPGGFGPQGRLHGFQLTPGRLRMQQGDGTLLSIDVADGRLLWAFKAPPSGEQAGRLNPLWFACGKYVLIEQLPTKTLLALAAESGAPLGELPRADAASPMPRVPIALDSDHVALALDERTLGRFDLAHVALDWVHRDEAALPRAAPIRAWFEEGALLALQGGRTLVRLDPKSGQQVWERSLGLAKSGAVGGPVAVSEELVYALDGHEVRAFRLNDGAPAWSRPVASERGAHWSIGLSGPYLVVFPRVSETDPDGLSTITFDYWNRESGAPMHRFPFGAPARRLEVVLGDQSVLVASEARGWLLGRKP